MGCGVRTASIRAPQRFVLAGAAQGTGRKQDAKAQIYRCHDARQHARVGLAAAHDQGADSLAAQGRRQARIGEGGVHRLVQDAGRRAKAGERFGQHTYIFHRLNFCGSAQLTVPYVVGVRVPS